MRSLILCLAMVAAPVAAAQSPRTVTKASDEQDGDDRNEVPVQQSAPIVENQSGRIAKTSAGEVGQRLTRAQRVTDARPLDRLAGRLQTRIQNRLRTRIDRNYDPRATTTDPFTVAEVESVSSPRRR